MNQKVTPSLISATPFEILKNCTPSRWLKSLMLMLLVMGLGNTASKAQTTLTIGTSTSTTNYMPLYTCYGYNYSQQIILASEVVSAGASSGTAAYISSVSFYAGSISASSFNTYCKDWVIYLGNTTKSSFSGSTDWVSTSSMTKVFDGTVTATGSGWLKINFTTSFYWDGTSNIVIGVDENTANYYCTAYWRYSSKTNRALSYYNDYTNPNPASPPSGTRRSYVNNVQFDYVAAVPCSGTPTGGSATASATSICPGASTMLSVTGSTAGLGLSYQWESATSGSGPWSTMTDDTLANCSATPPAGTTTYYRRKITCNASSASAYSSGVAIAVGTALTLPYSEDFESRTAGVNVPCANALPSFESSSSSSSFSSASTWRLLGSSSGSMYGASGPRSGSKYLWTGYGVGSYASNPVGYWFTPGISLSAGKTYRFSYWYRVGTYYAMYYSSSGTDFGMYYGTDNTTSTGLTAIAPDLISKANTSYAQNIGDFTVPTTGTYYLAIKVDNKGFHYYGGGDIDDLGLIELPDCNTATPATFASGGKATASPSAICSLPGTVNLTVSGTPAFSGLSFAWERDTSNTFATATTVATTAAATNSITTSGTYYYRCKVSCLSTSTSVYSDTVKVFTTPITPPYIEDFEGVTPGSNVPCASYTYSWGDYYWWTRSGTHPYASGIRNHTTGGSKYLHAGIYLGSIVSGGDEFWFTPGLALTAKKAYDVSFWYSNSAYSTGYSSYSTSIGVRAGTSQTKAAMTIVAGADTNIYVNASMTPSYDKLSRGFIAPTTGTYYVGIKVNHSYYNYYGFAIDDIGINQLPPCSAKPSAGKVVATPARICTSGSSTLSLSGTTLASDLSFQWYEVIAGTPTALVGDTGMTYTTPFISSGTRYYFCVVSCPGIGAPNSDTTATYVLKVGPLDPPYIEDFESAIPGTNIACASYTTGWDASPSGAGMYRYWGIKNAPGVSYPSVKNRTPGGSNYLSAGYYLSSMYMGSSSANQYWFSPAINLIGGYAYECNYWYVNGYTYYPNTFGLYYGTSQSASAMTAMTPDIGGTTNTTYKEIKGSFIAPSSGAYYLGIKVDGGYNYYGCAIDDIGLKQLPLCSAKPTAGTVDADPALICSSGTSKLSLVGTAMASMLQFQWQDSSASTGGLWVNSVGATATTANYTTPTLTATRWYRCIVTCPLIGAPNTDTTPVYTMNVGAIIPPYKENFEKGKPGINMPCAGYTYSWGSATSTNYWTLRGSSYSGYITVGNHTPGGSKFLWAGYYLGMGYPRDHEFWFTPAIRLTKDSTYEFSYWYMGSGYPYGGTGTTLGMYYGTSQTKAAMTTPIAADLTGVNTSSYEQYIGRFVAPSTNNYYIGIKVRNYSYMYYGIGIDDINLEQLPICTGAPTVGKVTAKPTMLCSPGGSINLNMDMAGVSRVGGLTYQWYSYPAMTPVSPVLTSVGYTVTGVMTGGKYVCVVKCTNTGDSTISSPVKVDVGAIIPPYIEDFETATPGTNMPCASYTYSWGSYYYWSTMGSPITYGPSALENHTTGGNKYLIAGYYIGYPGYSGSSEEYWLSPAIALTAGKRYQVSYWYKTDGYTGVTYKTAMYMGTTQSKSGMTTLLGSIVNPTSSKYKMYKHQFVASSSGNFYFGIMKGANNFGYGMAFDDIGIQEVPPCSSVVEAGVIATEPWHICSPGGTTVLDLEGSSLATGLTYEWFSSSSPSGPFVTTGGSSLPYTSDPLYADTWFKCVVTCSATGATDTTDAIKVGVGAFDLPYKEDFESVAAGEKPICSEATIWGQPYFFNTMSTNYGGLDNNTPGGSKYLIGGYYLGYYSYTYYGYTLTDDNFWFTPGLKMDNRYKYELSFHYQNASSYKNKIGVFYGTSQSAGSMSNTVLPLFTLDNGASETFDTTFSVPAKRVYYFGFQKTSSSTGSYGYPGVAFDDININYAPCQGMPFVGYTTSSKPSGTSMCPGNYVKLVNSGSAVTLVPGITHQWYRRVIGTMSWSPVVGATDTILAADTLVGYEYSLSVKCTNSGDSVMSIPFQVPAYPPHPPVVISPSASPVTFCLGDTLKFTATNYTGAVYDWMLDSVVVPGWKFNDMGATEPGTYMVRVTSALSPCPGYSNQVTMVVNDPGYSVSITKPADSIICAGSSITLSAIGSKPGLTYHWRKNNVDIPGAFGTNLVVTSTGYYRVMAYDGMSVCKAASRNVLITVKPNPPAIIYVPGGTTTACEDEGVLLNANLGGYTYQWMRGGSSIFGWKDSSVIVKNSGVYSVKVITPDGCMSVSSSINVNILPSPTPTITKSGLVLNTMGTYVAYQWIRNGVDMSGETNPNLNLTKNGVYKVRVTDANGCKGESNPIEVNEGNLGVSQQVQADQIKLYPNPTESKVYIESPIGVSVQVKDVSGRILMERNDVKEVDLSSYADGIYLFKISNLTGTTLIEEQRINKISKK